MPRIGWHALGGRARTTAGEGATPPTQTIADGFASAVDDYELAALAADRSTIIGVDADLRIALLNPAYARFAEQNGGGPRFLERWGLGASLMAAIPEVLTPFYGPRFRAALAASEPWQHTYECSSPDIERTMHLTAFPLGGRGLLLVHSLRVEVPHTRALVNASVEAYRSSNGLIVQCSHCRRLRHPDDANRWDFVPAAVIRAGRQVSHGICQPCAGHYFGG